MDVSPKVIEIIAREQHLDVSKITLDSTFAELGIDSLDGVNILFALEEEFKLDIPDTVAQNMRSVRQVVDSLTRVLEGKDVSDLVAMAKGESSARRQLNQGSQGAHREESRHHRDWSVCVHGQECEKLLCHPGRGAFGRSAHPAIRPGGIERADRRGNPRL